MFEERYKLEDLDPDWVRSLEVVIVGDGTDKRVSFIPARFCSDFKGQAYRLSYEMKTEQCTVAKLERLDPMSETVEIYSGDITVGLPRALDSIGVRDRNVLVDITGMKHPALFYLFKLLIDNYKPKRLFGGYTEPERYVPHGSTEIEEHFQLFEGYLGICALPGFARLPDDRKNKCLVAFLGFEGARLQYVHGEVEPGERDAVAVIGFPAFRPGWQNVTIASNQSALQSTRTFLYVRTATAFSPFDAYRVLEELQADRPNERLIVAPIGTRPHALGCALYAIGHPTAYLLYDFPIEVQQHRTENTGICHVYHLSSFL
ncbi:hypothetical protein ACFLXE_00255 [Chloroflexota bacterium]